MLAYRLHLLDESEVIAGINREIGVAVGVLTARDGLTRQQAFDVLRVASKNSNRRLTDLATDVGDTGALPVELGRSSAP